MVLGIVGELLHKGKEDMMMSPGTERAIRDIADRLPRHVDELTNSIKALTEVLPALRVEEGAVTDEIHCECIAQIQAGLDLSVILNTLVESVDAYVEVVKSCGDDVEAKRYLKWKGHLKQLAEQAEEEGV